MDKNWKAPFFALWTGQAISLLGSRLVQFALVWWLTQETGSATVLALATLVVFLPHILLGPPAGVLVDRWNRRLIMLAADSLTALATVALAALFWVGLAEVWHVVVLMLIREVAGVFHETAMTASTTLMVPDSQLARVAGLNQALRGGLTIAAPPLGALLLGLLPLQGVLAIDVGTALFGIGPLLFILVPQPKAREQAVGAAAGASFVEELRAGLRYVGSWPGLMILLGMASLINFMLTPASALLPILVTKHFDGGVFQLATLESVFGFGMLGGGVLLSVWGGFKRRIVTSLIGLIGLGLGFAVVGLAPAHAFWLAVAASTVAAVMQPLINGPIMAVMQSSVAPEMQGRVFTLIGSVAMAMSPLSLLVAGPLADALGVQWWYVVGGLACALIGAAGFLIPAVIGLEDGRADAAEAGPAETAPAAEFQT